MMRTQHRLPGKATFLNVALLAVLQWLCLGVPTAAGQPANNALTPPDRLRVLRVQVHDTLQPERANVFIRTLEGAEQQGYAAILLELSTPGGLHQPTDEMVTAMQRSSVPIVVWVDMPQTRVSGEGLRLLAAADVSVMNSAAFLTPLWTDRVHGYRIKERARMSTELQEQLQQQAVLHGRGTSQLEELSAGSHWFTAREAVETGLVDGVADRAQDALRVASGRTITKANRTVVLPALQGAQLVQSRGKLQETLLLTLMNPNICVLLLTLGMLLIYLEVNTPGAFVPGIAGVLLAMLAIYALHLLPLNLLSVLLCLLASIMLLLEGRFPSHGLLAFAGVLFLVVGLGKLVNGPVPQLQVEWSVAWGAGIGFGGVTAALIVLGLRARRAKMKTGADAMLGWLAVAHTALAPEGKVLVRGELWTARLTSSDSSVAAGDRVKVLRAEGSTLEVAALPLGDNA